MKLNLPLLANLLVGGLVLSFAGCADEDHLAAPDRAHLVQQSEKIGLLPEIGADLAIAQRDFYENRVTQKLFDTVVRVTENRNVNTRSEAFSTFASLRGTSYHEKAIKEIDRMAKDPAPEIRDRYPWVAWLAEHPRWREICQIAARSNRPEAVRLAKQALDLGPRPPKRKQYALTPPKAQP